MSYTFSNLSLDEFAVLNNRSPEEINYPAVFSLPEWLTAWWQVFGGDYELLLAVIRKDDEEIGVAPLKVKNKKASFIGDKAVCDYLDFVVKKGNEEDFFEILLDELVKRCITNLELEALRRDSTVIKFLKDVAGKRGYKVDYRKEDVSVVLDLPGKCQDYLGLLSGKQRHEIRRKTRRLKEHGVISYRVYREKRDVIDRLPLFLRLFKESRSDKAGFMTEKMKLFFKKMTEKMASRGIMGLGFLELNREPVASVMYFDYNNTRYLYNSGYHPGYEDLSIGLLSKVFCIEDAIKQRLNVFDFLKGGEIYKYRLGGKEVSLYRCHIGIG